MDIHTHLAADAPQRSGRLCIRGADDEADIERLRSVSREFHEETRFHDFPFSPEKHDRALRRVIADPDRHLLLIAELHGEPVGYAICSPLGGGRADLLMMSAVVRWSRTRKAREVRVHVTSGIDVGRTDRYPKRAKLTVTFGDYSFSLTNDP